MCTAHLSLHIVCDVYDEYIHVHNVCGPICVCMYICMHVCKTIRITKYFVGDLEEYRNKMTLNKTVLEGSERKINR